MDRRSLIKFGGMAALGFAVEGCAPTSAAKPQLAPRVAQARRVLPVVNASWDRVIRTTIGLRPHRPSGFVLRAEKLDSKTLIHNFGHGGSGMSLSWGTASMATDLALPHAGTQGRGAGIRRRRTHVRARAAASRLRRHDLRGDACRPTRRRTCRWRDGRRRRGSSTTSCERRQWDEQCRHAARIAYRRLQLLAGPKYGVSWIRQYQPTDTEPSAAEAQSERRIPCLPPELAGSSWDRARSRRASVRDEVLLRARRDAHRAVDLPRRADERLPVVGRQGRDPQVRHAARRRRAQPRT